MFWQVAVGAILLFVVPPMLIAAIEVGPWITNIRQWQTGLGAYWGAVAGLGAILLGAIYNAKLNREHVDWVQGKEIQAIAAAFRAEILEINKNIQHLYSSSAVLSKITEDETEEIPKQIQHIIDDYAKFDVFNSNCNNIGLLGPDASTQIVKYYRNARIIINMYSLFPISAVETESFKTLTNITKKNGEITIKKLAIIMKSPSNP